MVGSAVPTIVASRAATNMAIISPAVTRTRAGVQGMKPGCPSSREELIWKSSRKDRTAVSGPPLPSRPDP